LSFASFDEKEFFIHSYTETIKRLNFPNQFLQTRLETFFHPFDFCAFSPPKSKFFCALTPCFCVFYQVQYTTNPQFLKHFFPMNFCRFVLEKSDKTATAALIWITSCFPYFYSIFLFFITMIFFCRRLSV